MNIKVTPPTVKQIGELEIATVIPVDGKAVVEKDHDACLVSMENLAYALANEPIPELPSENKTILGALVEFDRYAKANSFTLEITTESGEVRTYDMFGVSQ